MFSLICAWTNSWVNNRDAGDLRCYWAHYDITVMQPLQPNWPTLDNFLHCQGKLFMCSFQYSKSSGNPVGPYCKYGTKSSVNKLFNMTFRSPVFIWHKTRLTVPPNEIHQKLNSSTPSAAYMHQWTGSALVQVMACRLFGAKPLPEPMLTYCRLDH